MSPRRRHLRIKILLDENVPLDVKQLLKTEGYSVTAVTELRNRKNTKFYRQRKISDKTVLEYCALNKTTLVTLDKTDFPYMGKNELVPRINGIIVVRAKTREPSVICQRILKVLNCLTENSLQGSIITTGKTVAHREKNGEKELLF